jgi:hypothetical protein
LGIACQQQFTFLPGLHKGLALSANYTVIASQVLRVERKTNGPDGAAAMQRGNEPPFFLMMAQIDC